MPNGDVSFTQSVIPSYLARFICFGIELHAHMRLLAAVTILSSLLLLLLWFYFDFGAAEASRMTIWIYPSSVDEFNIWHEHAWRIEELERKSFYIFPCLISSEIIISNLMNDGFDLIQFFSIYRMLFVSLPLPTCLKPEPKRCWNGESRTLSHIQPTSTDYHRRWI